MQFELMGVSKMTLDHQKGSDKSSLVSTEFFLEISGNMDPSIYINELGLPRKEGLKPLTMCFVHGLLGNIHYAHQTKQWDSAEHLRYIIAELERGFVAVANVELGTFKRRS